MFSCFSSKSLDMPEGEPQTWDTRDVKQWLKYTRLDQFGKTFVQKGIDGKALLTLSPKELQRLQGKASPSDAQRLAEAILKLAVADQQAPNGIDAAGESLVFSDRVTWESVPDASAYPHQPAIKGNVTTHKIDTEAQRDEDALRAVFHAFASYGSGGAAHSETEMDATKMMKLVRDCTLLDSKLTAVDVDFIFIKVKSREKRRITFGQFQTAVQAMADKKGVPLDSVKASIISQGGPVTHGTRAESVRLHDDKSTYTGVYKQGGPTTVDESHDLATFVDRNAKKPPPHTPPQTGMSKSKVVTSRRQTMCSVGGTPPSAPLSLEATFESFAAFGSSAAQRSSGCKEMDNTRFVKLCRDCGLFDGKFTTTDADLLFKRFAPKGKGHSKITFAAFENAMAAVAVHKGMDPTMLQRDITCSGGPMINSTCA